MQSGILRAITQTGVAQLVFLQTAQTMLQAACVSEDAYTVHTYVMNFSLIMTVNDAFARRAVTLFDVNIKKGISIFGLFWIGTHLQCVHMIQ